jgi:sulfate transport system ATP-binding protein
MSIQLSNLVKIYQQQTVVDNVSLQVDTGELFVLLGASGSGKSTILRMIAGLTPMNSGQIWLHGRDVSHLSPQKRDTGFVFQNYSLFKHMTVEQNIAFALNIRHVSKQETRRRVAELLELIELQGFEKRLPWQLSGGQKQRVALARALAHQPSVLLLDEPFGALDVKIRTQLRRNLREIQKRLQVTTILVTHDQEEAFDVADRIGIIEAGKLLETGTPHQLYHRPQHIYTASFLGTANFLPAQRNSHFVAVGEVSLAAPANTEHLEGLPVMLMCRPEDIQVSDHPEQLNGSFIGRGKVEGIAFSGAYDRVTIRLNAFPDRQIQVFLTPEHMRSLALQIDQQVYVGLQDFHLLDGARTNP